MIFNRSSWCRFSQGVGGSTIDFLEYFRNMDFYANFAGAGILVARDEGNKGSEKSSENIHKVAVEASQS